MWCRSVALVVGLGWFSACGGGTEEPPADGLPLPVVSLVVGSGGGVLEVSDPAHPLYGAKLTIPPGAVPTATTFSIDRSTGAPDTPPGLEPAGPAMRLSPSGGFDLPIGVGVPVLDSDDDGLIDGANAKLESVGVFRFDEVQGDWQELPGSVEDPAAARLNATTDRFSWFRPFVRRIRVASNPDASAVEGVPYASSFGFGVSNGEKRAALIQGPPGMTLSHNGLLQWASPTAGAHPIAAELSSSAGGGGVRVELELRVLASEAVERLQPSQMVHDPDTDTSLTVQTLARRYCPVLRLSGPSVLQGPEFCERGTEFGTALCGRQVDGCRLDYWPISVEALLATESAAGSAPTQLVAGDGATKTDPGVADLLLSGGDREAYLDLLGVGRTASACRQAERYEQPFLESDPPPTIYYTVVRAPGGQLCLQYWFLYLVNAWNSDHEGDWETISVFFDSAGYPSAVATSAHYEGRRRCWDDVQKLRTTDGVETAHPIIYVANGSHASFLASGRSTTGIFWVDRHLGDGPAIVPGEHVGVVSFPSGDPLPSEILPLSVDGLRPVPLDPSGAPAGWSRYEGRWGHPGSPWSPGSQGPRGPHLRLSGLIWQSPWTWSSGAYVWPHPVVPRMTQRVRDDGAAPCTPVQRDCFLDSFDSEPVDAEPQNWVAEYRLGPNFVTRATAEANGAWLGIDDTDSFGASGRSLKIVDTGGYLAGLRRDLQPREVLDLRFALKIQAAGEIDDPINVTIQGPGFSPPVSLVLWETAVRVRTQVGDGNDAVVGAYQHGIWHEYAVVVDTRAGTITTSQDGTELDSRPLPGSPTGISRIYLTSKGASQGTLWLDEIKLR